MQQNMGQYEDELNKTKERLRNAEEERDQAFNKLKEMKKVVADFNMNASESFSMEKLPGLQTEINSLKELLSLTRGELKMKEKQIGSLELELKKAKELELKLAQKDVSLEKLKEEMGNFKLYEAQTKALLSESRDRIQKMEAELDKRKESEANLYNSLITKTKQFEETKILLEELKFEIASLHDNVEKVEGSSRQNKESPHKSQTLNGDHLSMKETIENLQTELQQVKENLTSAQEGEKLVSSKVKNQLEEISLLKNELKLATEAEKNSKKAMDDLALALKEVATEATQMHEKLTLSQVELEHTKEEADRLRVMLKTTEEKYKELLDEARKEADLYKNTADRLRLEAEETLMTWNGKETGLVDCIKRAEEERTTAQEETSKIRELLTVAEDKNKASKEETQKLRDILKQALNEANVAKEAAGIAREENSQLKDCLAAKEDALNFLTQENESLKIHEAAAFENIKELKRLLYEASSKELKKDDKEKSSTKESKKDKEDKEKSSTKELKKEKDDKEATKKSKVHNSTEKEHKDGKHSRTFSFSLKELKIPYIHKEVDEDQRDHESDDAVKGSIFDVLGSPDHSPSDHLEGEIVNSSEEFEHLDETHFDDIENDRNSRKKRALLRRFGDLIKRKGVHAHTHSIAEKKESPIEKPCDA
ncbi:WEB family protein, chloroplastic [Quillaja saponaria]|uniref:WEB family protein, chloroplastic n=1 Tax=Quillaja saponaria TaxID=32244 RepID=A0AAD7P7X5_QUISA|nr:WEB family protein, chloroplastic [Quillaja saponaria]